MSIGTNKKSALHSDNSHGPTTDQCAERPLSQIRADFSRGGSDVQAVSSARSIAPAESPLKGSYGSDDEEDVPLAFFRSSFVAHQGSNAQQGSESDNVEMTSGVTLDRYRANDGRSNGHIPLAVSPMPDDSAMVCDDDLDIPLAFWRNRGNTDEGKGKDNTPDEQIAHMGAARANSDDQLSCDHGANRAGASAGSILEGSDVDALESDGEAREPAATLATFVVDQDEMQDYGIEVRKHIPNMPTADGNHESFEHWLARSSREDVQRERRAVEELGRAYQKADRLHRLLLSLRDTATGLLLSPYVGAASALQGTEVVVSTGTSDNQGSEGPVSNNDMEG